MYEQAILDSVKSGSFVEVRVEALEEIYIRACEIYNEGDEFLTDAEFDRLDKELRARGSQLPNKLHEDVGETTDIKDTDIDDESYSIRAVTNWNDVAEFFSSYPDSTFIATLKEDGVCTKLAIDRNNMFAQSRNRHNKRAIDFSQTMNMVVKKPIVLTPITITGESYVPWEDLICLREKYDPEKYKMPKSAALSLLRTPEKHETEDVKRLVFTAFNTNRAFPTHAQKLDWLATRGFRTPKYQVFKPDLTRDIREQLLPIMQEVDTGAPSDGIVIEVNECNTIPAITGKYMSTQIALKLDKWEAKDHYGTVVDLDITPAKGSWGCVLVIEDVVMADGATVNRVNAYNLGIVHRNRITRGSRIRFARVSNTICNLIYER